MTSSCDLLIVGAGAAGIGAAHAAQNAGLHMKIIEASHRVGGRGLTEELAPGIPWDLGCHWLHSGSINPLAKVADELGYHYDKSEESRAFYMKGGALTETEQADYQHYNQRHWMKIEASAARGEDVALGDLVDFDSRWAPYYCYWQSLMTSEDIDRFSALDLLNFEDTDENWPVQAGYGSLLSHHAENLTIELNTRVEKIDWSGTGTAVLTNRGTINAKRVIVTVSTGVLGGKDIQFIPELPQATQEAIRHLSLEPWPFDADTPERIDYSNGDDINFGFKLKCSGWPYIYCAVAGRQARWLERQARAESEQLMMNALVDIFGSDFRRKIVKFNASAWGDDPLVKGAYSSSAPGQSHQRSVLATPIADRVYFAGEATSVRAFCTAHGAWETGRDAVARIIAGN